ncbi:hypothetical protein LguiA_031079 [Lonicera macranthoides]
MAAINITQLQSPIQPIYDRTSELKAFDETKARAKGLVDTGITQVFLVNATLVDKVREASQTWGFFQVINHGILVKVLEEMIDGVRRFFEQDAEVKKQCELEDSIGFVWAPEAPNPEEVPVPCSCNCKNGFIALGHYYPACPQPEKTIGTSRHTDSDFFTVLTVLLQDHIGGLQVLHQNQWVNVPPTPRALVVNIGDLLQASLMSNDKFKSVEHRVLANRVGPKVSVAGLFGAVTHTSAKM